MKDIVEKYVGEITSKFSHSTTSEYGYRTPFEILLREIFAEMDVRDIGHDDRSIGGNKPDFVIRKNDVPLLYIEAKDFGVSLDKIEQSDQMSRYFGYDNLILSDYVEFRFYRFGVPYGEPIKITEYDVKNRTIIPKPENYEYLAKTLLDFTQSHKEKIKSGAHLAKIMGGKAQRIRDNVHHLFISGSEKNADLVKLYDSLKELLVHDLSPKSFADMYAQTLVYGLFVARFYDESLGSFSRQEARELIPNSNRFLKHFFDHIVGADFKSSLRYLVDELCEVFSHANVAELMDEYFKDEKKKGIQKSHDQVIHFYEDFLNEYDKKLRRDFGAYYTPEPVVDFIIKSTDYLLKKKFDIKDGLSDISKVQKGIHKVQILDPAVGTGTFINAVIREIYTPFVKNKQEGRWPAYVHNDLLPRIHGFELMMAPYTIAHLRLGIAFRKTGFWDFHRRLGIYLTNSLEEGVKQQDMFAFGLAESIVDESKEASVIKNETPIMVVTGNPPYKGESNNKFYKGHDVYKVEPTGGRLQEKNSKWLNDDYVKFIRFAENMVEKTGEGIVAMITAHGYIDNPTFRGMRWHLMNSFDEIYILDLHGNSRKKEKSPNGSIDQNVFDIETGVSIFFGVKKANEHPSFAKIYKSDLYGKRIAKFKYLSENLFPSVKWEEINPIKPNYEWNYLDPEVKRMHDEGFSIDELFELNNSGIVTKRDKLCIQETRKEMWQAVEDFVNLPENEVRQKYKIPTDVRDWKFEWAKKDLLDSGLSEESIVPVIYRPFDSRFMYYTGKARGFVGWPIERISKHFVSGENLALILPKQLTSGEAAGGFVTRNMGTHKAFSAYNINYYFPLYLYTENKEKVSNLKKEIVDKIENIVDKISPEDIFDYVYAVLHSTSYQNKYKQLLKSNFPKIPYPRDKETYRKLVKLGRELRDIHLLNSLKVAKFITTYPIAGDNVISQKPEYKEGKVYINDMQYFGNVSETAWNLKVGGYQPAERWLRDRKGHELTNEDIEHYQKVIVALTETEKIKQDIDKVEY